MTKQRIAEQTAKQLTVERLSELRDWVKDSNVCLSESTRDSFKELLTEIDRLRAAHSEQGWVSGNEIPEDVAVLAEIEYLFNTEPITERVVCMLAEDSDELVTEAGDDIGWTTEVIVRWRPLPAPPVHPESAQVKNA